MNDRQENKLSMYNKVTTFLTEKAADLAAYPIIATIKTKVENKVTEIVLAEAIAGSDNTGYTQVKAQAQATLLAQTLKVGSAAAMYYTVTMPDISKREKVDYKKSELELMRDSDQYVASKRVHDVADSIKTLLAPFGVVAADVDALATARQTFYAVMQIPKEKFAEAVGAGKTVDRLMDETDVILSEELDTQMQIVSVDDIDLYEIYKVARLIDDTGSSGGGSETILDTKQGFVAGGMKVNLGVVPAGATQVRLKTLDGGPLEFGISSDGLNFDGDTFTVNPGGEMLVLIADFNSTGTTFVVSNLNVGAPGEYKVEFIA